MHLLRDFRVGGTGVEMAGRLADPDAPCRVETLRPFATRAGDAMHIDEALAACDAHSLSLRNAPVVATKVVSIMKLSETIARW